MLEDRITPTAYPLIDRVFDPTPAEDDRFGHSSALFGNIAVVGAPRDDVKGTNSGAAYLIDVDTGDVMTVLNAPNPAAADYFGSAVGITGGLAVVGAPFDDSGAAFVYDVGTGQLLSTLHSPNPESDERFGSAVTASDVDIPNFASATIAFAAGYVSGHDVLSFADANGIFGSSNAATGVLTLNGSSSVANYQSALRSIVYANGSDNPSTTDRTLNIAVSDGASSSNTVMRTISVTATNDVPTDLALSSTSVLEDTSVNVPLATLHAFDADGDSLSFNLVAGSGADNNSQFRIVADKLHAVHVMDFETRARIMVYSFKSGE